MRRIVGFSALVLFLFHGAAVLAGGERFVTLHQCPHAEILCLEKVGYNYQICGPLTGLAGETQEFPLCPASDRGACVPCWFSSVEVTADYCRETYGPDCGHFTEQNANWKGEWKDLDWPDLTPFYSLWRNSPFSEYSEQ